jgi:hypothetical protein
MLCEEVIVMYCGTRMKYTNISRGPNAKFLDLEIGGTYNYEKPTVARLH